MYLSRSFTLEEMVRSEYATRKGIDNIPSQEVINNLRYLCVGCLQPLRDKLGKPIQITSGYRCPELNAAIGGSRTSQHMRGEAADIVVSGMTSKALFDYIVKCDIHFDQIIEEFGAWVHISFCAHEMRGHKLQARLEGGKTIYQVVV